MKQHPKDEPGTEATVVRGDGTVQSGAEAQEETANKANDIADRAAVRSARIQSSSMYSRDDLDGAPTTSK